MSKSAFPTPTEVTAFLTSVGITVPGGYVLADDVDAAVQIVERESGWLPFLQDAADVARSFDPPLLSTQGTSNPNNGLMIPFRAGLLTLTSVTINSTALVQNRDFWLEPSSLMPWCWMKLKTFYIAPPQSVVVTGKWGYSATVPADIWRAVRDYAAYLAASNFQTKKLTSPVRDWQEKEIKESYDKAALLKIVEDKEATLEKLARSYKRNQ